MTNHIVDAVSPLARPDRIAASWVSLPSPAAPKARRGSPPHAGGSQLSPKRQEGSMMFNSGDLPIAVLACLNGAGGLLSASAAAGSARAVRSQECGRRVTPELARLASWGSSCGVPTAALRTDAGARQSTACTASRPPADDERSIRAASGNCFSPQPHTGRRPPARLTTFGGSHAPGRAAAHPVRLRSSDQDEHRQRTDDSRLTVRG